MSKPTLQEWKDWADKIIAGKWHTTMLNAFCRQAVEDREELERLREREKELGQLLIESCDAEMEALDLNEIACQQRNEAQARLDELKKRLKEFQNSFWACEKHSNKATLRCAICDEEALRKAEDRLRKAP